MIFSFSLAFFFGKTHELNSPSPDLLKNAVLLMTDPKSNQVAAFAVHLKIQQNYQLRRNFNRGKPTQSLYLRCSSENESDGTLTAHNHSPCISWGPNKGIRNVPASQIPETQSNASRSEIGHTQTYTTWRKPKSKFQFLFFQKRSNLPNSPIPVKN